MLKKKLTRLRRARRTRCKIREDKKTRLCIFRSGQHIYAQVMTYDGAKVLASASSVEKTVRTNKDSEQVNKTEKAKIVGGLIAERALAEGIKSVAFDRSGFKYHGRVKALADAAREGGLDF